MRPEATCASAKVFKKARGVLSCRPSSPGAIRRRRKAQERLNQRLNQRLIQRLILRDAAYHFCTVRDGLATARPARVRAAPQDEGSKRIIAPVAPRAPASALWLPSDRAPGWRQRR